MKKEYKYTAVYGHWKESTNIIFNRGIGGEILFLDILIPAYTALLLYNMSL